MHGFDWVLCNGGPIKSRAHWGSAYNNAFWDAGALHYGDGDQVNFREFSGGIDVVAHELTHGLTECTSALV